MAAEESNAPKSTATKREPNGATPQVTKRQGSRAGEPRVSSSRAGSGGGRGQHGGGSQGEDDVLARLNRLGEPAPSAVPSAEPMNIPDIVEADPSFPALDRASTQVIESLSDGHATVAQPPAQSVAETIPDAVFAVSTLDAPAVPTRQPYATVIDTQVALVAPAAQPEPVTARPVNRSTTLTRRKPRVRRVTRVVRHVDTWSVFKVALVFNATLYLVCLTSAVLLWNVANATGTVDNIEKFFEQFGWETFQFNGGELYHNGWIAGLFIAVGLTGFTVLLATLFNLITDLVGGIRVSVLEEEVVARSPARESDHVTLG